MDKKKLSRLDLQQMKDKKEILVWITAYDYWTARFAEEAGMEMILVGDSLGMCVYGYEGTVPVTMDQCICHCEAVRRAAVNTFVIGDMPFLSYQVSVEDAVRNAGRFYKEARVDAIKLEGGRRVCAQIRAIVDAGMMVMGHIGLTPQSSGQLGGFKAQGRTAEAAMELITDARAIQEAGAFSLLVEAVPPEVCRIDADGQLMICSDVLGVFQAFTPKFVKKYDNIADRTIKAFAEYAKDVRSGEFPAPEHTYKMVEGELSKLEKLLNG
jgi:3-methyl-2-oxobutanoate hydroxymethyltransferase